MTKIYTIKKDRFEHKAGTTVYEYLGYDYGLARDDERYSGVEHTNVSLSPGQTPFFTVPTDDLEFVGNLDK